MVHGCYWYFAHLCFISFFCGSVKVYIISFSSSFFFGGGRGARELLHHNFLLISFGLTCFVSFFGRFFFFGGG